MDCKYEPDDFEIVGYLGIGNAEEEISLDDLLVADLFYWNTPKELLIDYINNLPEGQRFDVCIREREKENN